MPRAVIILNPAAGKSAMVDQMDRITDKLRLRYDEVVVYQTEAAGDGAAYIQRHAAEFDLIIGFGGDGTIHELINALCPLAERPLFAILPGGTCNDFSRAIGMNQDPLLAVEQILVGRVKHVDVGRSGSRYFLNFWGIGLITLVSNNIDSDQKERLGKLSYYISAAQSITGFEPFSLKITSADFDYDNTACLLVISNGAYTGGMRTFFPETDLEDGLFDVLIIKETSMELAWKAIQLKLTGEMPEGGAVCYFKTNKLSIEASPGQEIDCDGEIGDRTPDELENVRQHLAVLVGDLP
ncbi:diacylglycerol/lipid kinase family protein [Paenibacillus nasutitermitis]|uniref:Bis(5'-nucleosyl)-tetraphosphatase n=1 Tax=Paenibacillus nasutitermitis TaxID=1652958 RepID=A0A916ZDE3_9BACL|nr:diacylglycerol kinase family protein [Paenibacillus nasutitermitis]GGD90395.1 bis(5'-nucleosyl)-tetraphosphatase [Paenibacillus nasutitermitis]